MYCSILLIVSALWLAPMQAIPKSLPFTGTVTDSEGAVIANAQITVHWDSAGSRVGLATNVGTQNDVIARTDGEGRFRLDLPPGFYDVFVSAMAFSPQCTKVRVLRPVKLNPKLQADPIVTKELGDEFHLDHHH
jgi:hypothetical protein